MCRRRAVQVVITPRVSRASAVAVRTPRREAPVRANGGWLAVTRVVVVVGGVVDGDAGAVVFGTAGAVVVGAARTMSEVDSDVDGSEVGLPV